MFTRGRQALSDFFPAVPGRKGSRSASAASKKPESEKGEKEEDLWNNRSSIKHGISTECNGYLKYQGICYDIKCSLLKSSVSGGLNSRELWHKRLPVRRLKLWVTKRKLWLALKPLSGTFRLYRLWLDLLISFDHSTLWDFDPWEVWLITSQGVAQFCFYSLHMFL